MTRRSYEAVLVPVVLYAVSFGLLFAASRALGVAAGEPPRLAAAIDAAQLFSPAGKLVSTWADLVDVALAAGKPSPLAPTILGGYLWAVFARAPHATLDGLTAVRLGSVVIAAATPPLVHALARPWLGRPLAVLAAALALFAPRALADGATLSGDGVAVAFVLAGLVLYLGSIERRSAPLGAFGAASLGLAAAVSTSTLIVVPVVLVHFALERRASVARLARSGLFPLPIVVAALPIVGVATFVLAQPYLLRHTFDRARELAIAALSPTVGAGTWAGLAPPADAIPRTHAAASLLVALPSTTAVLAVVGAIAILQAPRASFRDTGARARLTVLGVSAVVLWPIVAPSQLGVFPSHWALGVPLAAVLAAAGAGAIACALPGDGPRAFVLAAAAAAPLGACLPSPSLAAFFPAITGGPARAAEGGRLPLHDATPLGGLARAIDGLGLDAPTVYAPDVPADAWTWMVRLGRMRTAVVPVARPGNAMLLVVSGDPRGHGGTVIAEVRRDGQPVLTLLRR